MKRGKRVKLFYLLGEKIYCVLWERRKGNTLKKQAVYDIKNLYPGKGAEEKVKEYYIKKISLVLCVLTIGVLFSVLSFVKSYTESSIINEKYITRNKYGEGVLQTEVTAGFADGSKEQLTLQIGERRFKEEELEELYEQAVLALQEVLFSEGDSTEAVKHTLNFPQTLEGFPFEIQWESSNYTLVDYDGRVYGENLQAIGETVNLTAIFQYHDFQREYVFTVHVLPPDLSSEELRRKALAESVEQSEEKSAYEENYVLPDKVEGELVKWEETRESSALLLLMIAALTAVALYQIKDYELHRQVLLKQEEMSACYPEIVNRLVLYIGAGMTVRNAWRKIALDFKKNKGNEKRKGYIYQEMLFACYEMDGGASEGEAYERFGRRCGLQQYVKLSTLLVQNLQKGNSTMLAQLKEEAETAFTERMNQARKKGEEAGTKLLMPMMLLLGMVMIFIMIPAFGTFGM